ncbi:N-acyl-L-amino acid amidohydrolase [Bhargavaea cecembensis DSE10]|uniref:N-acyl-L-amino acid amidohydrolase n=1 Tax=Bhargavaea cecembensis DSE10 TaxID=1235279 RepID=M7N8N9_9BACL|nr:amidohydrolase [Bhargavaea cecembensis]EMR04968.1 N-acyl-L-amino acid amidohydrolase [Bhargavaea cecembensis DSE10]
MSPQANLKPSLDENFQACLKTLESLLAEMTEIRRHLHQYPELSHQEVETPKLIAEYYRKLGLEVRTEVGGRGVVATFRVPDPVKTIAFRADFDALPIQDEKDVPYKSKNPGVSHACGHDGHTAALLGFAKSLVENKDRIRHDVVLIHQFGEELYPGGAKAMISDGCLEGVDAIYGCHLQSMLPSGRMYYREGYIQAAVDTFEITVKGKGGHGAVPHEAVDPIVVASHIVTALQTIVSRSTDPLEQLVVSVGSIHAGDANNVIPGEAVMTGTIRSYAPETRKTAREKLVKIASSVADALDAHAEVELESGYDALWNHPEETKIVKKAMVNLFAEEDVLETSPVMPGEDFSYYTQHVPGSFFFTGARPEGEAYPHHHAKFDFDETAMLNTAKTFMAILHQY